MNLLRSSLLALPLLALTACPGPGPAGNPDGGPGTPGSDGGAEVCGNGADDDGDGYVDCTDQDCFGTQRCAVSCIDSCFQGSSICDPAGVRECQQGADGCFVFGAPTACEGGLVCSAGTCAQSCTDTCTEGAKACSGGSVVSCVKLSSGCTEWVSPTACDPGELCNAGTCVKKGSCVDQCQAGATRCTTAGQEQTCQKASSGCFEWALPQACTGEETCPATGNACVLIPCTTGDTRCQGLGVQTCDAQSNWVTTQSCPQACQAGACTTAVACTAGAVRCNQNAVEICNSSGTAWLYNQTCNVGCAQGVCTDPCTPGALRCNGNTTEECNAAGNGWTQTQSCSTSCYQGSCIQADLIVDGVTQTLEGEVVLQNSLVVRNGGQIVVGPSGELKIRARTVSIDGASSVVANAVGNDPRGSVTTGTCSVYSHCHDASSYICCNNASHLTTTVTMDTACASYGTQGCTSRTSSQCYGYGSNDLTSQGCPVAASATYDRDDDLSISEGSSLGTDLGGGLISIIAEQVTVDGDLTANGNGKASGGGILIAADSITGNKVVQAAGGAGGGGNGRVKLLRGSTNTFSGTVVGKKADSVMPPLALTSGSHPDSTRWYNDGVGDWVIAWSQPFPTVNGYYVRTSTNANDVPSPSTAAFLQAEVYSVNAENLVEGRNYFHIVAVDSGFNVGTVKNTFLANVNKTPPAIASQSHTQRQWTTNNAPYLTWTNPRDDANFTGYYYVLDHYADTVPSASNGTFTTNKQLLLSNLADGIWVFHLVNRDTKNATTRAASHFVLYLGSAPAAANMSGNTYDGSNASAPLEGVTLTFNRGLFSATSVANGSYTFNNGIYEGAWEVTASKAGYQSQTRTVTLVAGQPNNVNFTLTH